MSGNQPPANIEKILSKCEAILEYRFQDRQLLERALTHSSVARTRLDSNERLEFLGDSILGFVVCELLYKVFPQSPEGELTKFKSVLVSRNTCTAWCDRLKIDQLILVGKGISQQNVIPASVKAGVIESIIAGLYLDGGIDEARRFILQHLQDEVEQVVVKEARLNYKSTLQQMAQKIQGDTPSYRVVSEQGPDHQKSFQVAAVIGKRTFDPAWGNSKKEAEQKAAHLALEQLDRESGEIPNNVLEDEM